MFKTHNQAAMDSVGVVATTSKILIVDDDPIFRRVTGAYLEKQGYQVLQADNGLSALEQLRVNVPDLILCDLAMPILNGIEFAEEVSVQYPSLPLIVVSATDEMSEVVKALRHGIKDFLPKPITDYKHLSAAIESTLQDAYDHFSDQRDFSSQWFRVDGGGEIPAEQELHWHLDYLKQNPNAARDLLRALLPEQDTKLGRWQCSYRLLQPAETMPLVFDYRWLINGQFVFYIADSATAKEDAAATALLIRALFDDYIRNLKGAPIEMKDVAELVEKGMHCSEGAGQVKALFGVADMPLGTVTILPAGISSQWQHKQTRLNIAPGKALGAGCLSNFITQDLPIGEKATLLLSSLGTTNFALTIAQLDKLHQK